jgi:predicted hotdog family 3-hydroxylacyl-ACP dehydratase
MIDHAQIARLIPHAGAMCLLDRVVQWDALSIKCRARSHRDPGNPLRSKGRLGILCGIEYAAQAMALHGGLTGTSDEQPQQGFLASVRDVTCHAEHLDDIEGDLLIRAAQLLNEGGRVIYHFSLWDGARVLLAGRAAVLLQAAS